MSTEQNCDYCGKKVSARAFCDQCGRPLARGDKTWEELAGRDDGSRSFAVMFARGPGSAREALFGRLYSQKAYGRIEEILALTARFRLPESGGANQDGFWPALCSLHKGDCAELLRLPKNLREKALERAVASGAGENALKEFFKRVSGDETENELKLRFNHFASHGDWAQAVAAMRRLPKKLREEALRRAVTSGASEEAVECFFNAVAGDETEKELKLLFDYFAARGSWAQAAAAMRRLPGKLREEALGKALASGAAAAALAEFFNAVSGKETERELKMRFDYFTACGNWAQAMPDPEYFIKLDARKDLTDFYYQKALKFESEGKIEAAAGVLEYFVNGNIPYRDAFSRYMRLAQRIAAGNTAPPVPAGRERGAEGTLLNASAGGDAGLIAGDYEFLREIGRGAMAVVYKARQRSLDRRVAVKKMREEVRLNRREAERFLREARLTASLQHPNIVTVHAIIEHKSDIYIVLEYIDGVTLAGRLDGKDRPPPGETLAICRSVLSALEYAHSLRIVHRDLKPSNIMISSGGLVKVMDFGIAGMARETITILTGLADTSGTLAYMSPEQHLGKFDARSDVYSFGVMLYEMLTGELPFRGPDFLAQKRERAYARLRELDKRLPAEIEAFVDRCLSPESAGRYGSAQEAAGALAEVKTDG